MTGRFAPTPSGRMHIGNVYAMLGAWLSARKSGDSIRLRIEDIDEPRVVPGAAETMMRDLEWLGLGWDGEPVFQSSRHALYQEALELLSKLSFDEISDIISTGSNDSKPCSTTAGNEAATSEATPLIYPCFCSRADIRAASAPQEGDRFTVYPGTCRRLIASEPQRAKQRLANNDRRHHHHLPRRSIRHPAIPPRPRHRRHHRAPLGRHLLLPAGRHRGRPRHGHHRHCARP